MSTLIENQPTTPLSAESAARTAAAARGAYEHFALFLEGLPDYYGGAYAFVPRRSFDIRLVPR